MVLNIIGSSSIDREESGSAERPIYVDVTKATKNSDEVSSCNRPAFQIGKGSKSKALKDAQDQGQLLGWSAADHL